MTTFFANRYREFLIGSFVVATLFTIFYGAISDSPLPDHRLIVGFNDLLLHGLAFFTLSLLAFFIWGRVVHVVLALGLAAVILEFVQLFEPARNANLIDILASLSGIFAGLCLFKGLLLLTGRYPLKS